MARAGDLVGSFAVRYRFSARPDRVGRGHRLKSGSALSRGRPGGASINKPVPAPNWEDAMTSSSDHGLARRTLLKGAGLGVGAGLASGLAQAQVPGAAAATAREGPTWSAEYWAKKGEVPLNLWRKRVNAPKPGEPPLPVLFLVHGSSNSARSSYDLLVPGKGEYSLMNVMARYGFDVWTMDHDGYGYSGSS